MKLLSDNIALITGVLTNKSIAWSIAKQAHMQGARIVLSCQTEKIATRVARLTEEEKIDTTILACDFGVDDEVKTLFEKIGEMGKLRYAVHAIAFSDKAELTGDFLNVSDANFHTTMNISCLSFIKMARHCKALMLKNEPIRGDRGSIIGLTYGASTQPQPHYNVMSVAKAALESAMRNAAFELGPDGIRANMVSPSPEDTVSAHGIDGFRFIGDNEAGMSMLGRRVTLEEIADLSVFLLSDKASGITGQTIMVDGGASVAGMPHPRHARRVAENLLAIADKVDGRKTPTIPPPPKGEFLSYTGHPEEE